MIYYGDEAGMWGGDDPDNRKSMVWPELKYENETYSTVTKFTDSDPVAFDREIFDFYKQILHLCQRHPALRKGAITTLQKNAAAGIYAFRRDFENATMIAAFNISSQAQEVVLDIASSEKRLFREAVSKRISTLQDSKLQIKIESRSATIFEIINQ